MRDWLHSLIGWRKRNTRAELVAWGAYSAMYAKEVEAHEKTKGKLAQSEDNIEALRRVIEKQRADIALLEPRRAEAEKGAAAKKAKARQEFLDDTVVRGKRWGDLTEHQKALCLSVANESAIRQSLRELTAEVEQLREVVAKKTVARKPKAAKK